MPADGSSRLPNEASTPTSSRKKDAEERHVNLNKYKSSEEPSPRAGQHSPEGKIGAAGPDDGAVDAEAETGTAGAPAAASTPTSKGKPLLPKMSASNMMSALKGSGKKLHSPLPSGFGSSGSRLMDSVRVDAMASSNQ